MKRKSRLCSTGHGTGRYMRVDLRRMLIGSVRPRWKLGAAKTLLKKRTFGWFGDKPRKTTWDEFNALLKKKREKRAASAARSRARLARNARDLAAWPAAANSRHGESPYAMLSRTRNYRDSFRNKYPSGSVWEDR